MFCFSTSKSCYSLMIPSISKVHQSFFQQKYLSVFLNTEDTITPDQISNSICRNAATYLQGTSTTLYWCLKTLIVNLPPATAIYFKFCLISPEYLLPVFCTPVPMFLCIVESLSLVSTSMVWCFGHKKDLSGQLIGLPGSNCFLPFPGPKKVQALGVLLAEGPNDQREEAPPHFLCICL